MILRPVEKLLMVMDVYPKSDPNYLPIGMLWM